MTKIEELLLKAKEVKETAKEGEPQKSPYTFGELIAAIVEDISFLNRRLNNAEVSFNKLLKELHRIKARTEVTCFPARPDPKQFSFSEEALDGNEPK